MRVVLDLAKLLSEGKITEDEYEKFRRLSSGGTETLFSSIFLGMGLISALMTVGATFGPSLDFVSTSLFFSILLLGLYLARYSQQWLLLGAIFIAQISIMLPNLLLGVLWRAIWG